MRGLRLLVPAALALAGCGGSEPPRLYPTTFHLGPDEEARAPTRDGRYLDLVVDDGYCAGSPEQDPKRRLDHVDVREHPDALIVTVWMREEATLGEDELCSGVGTSFAHRVRLPRAIGRGGVIDAGVSRGEPWELELKPDDGDAIRRLRRRFDLYCPWNSGCAS